MPDSFLFVPRFDRVKHENRVLRLGQESLFSLAGIADFMQRISQDQGCELIARHATHPESEVLEFIRRDVLNVALGNTDNHGRNTALQTLPDGTVQLTPLFDFAPMMLDDAGIARNSRWTRAEQGGFPDWPEVVATVVRMDLGVSESALRAMLRALAARLRTLPKILQDCGVDEFLAQRVLSRTATVLQTLENV